MDQEVDVFPVQSEVAALIRKAPWAATPLGPPAAWPPSLRTVLRLMLTSRFSMWMGWGPDLRFFYNDAYARETLGIKHPWALGRPAREVWNEIWGDLEPRVTHVLTTGDATWDEGLLLFLERNGYREETYHTFSYSPAPGDSPGEVGGLFCVVVEETQRVIGERQMALLRDFAALLSQTNTTADVFTAVDACVGKNGRDLPFALAYLFEVDGKVAVRASSSNIDPAHRFAGLRVAVDESAPWPFLRVLSTGAPVVVELPSGEAWPTGAWSSPPTHAIVLPIDQGEERPAGVFIAGLNPHRPVEETARGFVQLFVGQLASGLSNARAYEAERTRADALVAIDRAKTAFFSNVSHEFRTPLTLMLAPIEDMRAEHEQDQAERDRLDLLHRNANRLLKLVNTLLDFSRIEAGRVEAVYEPTDIAALTADLASSFRAATERAGLALVVDCPPLPEPAYVDRTMWEKIVLNLLSNAFKFTFEGSITVRVRMGDEHIELEIADTGTGIAEADLSRVFERFHRIEGARSRSHEGSGIGLALVDEIVRLHGGDITVKSRVGQGTTFLIRLRRGCAHLPAALVKDVAGSARPPSVSKNADAYAQEALRWTDDVESAVATASERESDQGADGRARILFADDNADMRDYVGRLLAERWDVTLVATGDEALASMRRRPPDLVLSDIMMPGLDGFGLLRAIRADSLLRTTPVILLSARAGEDSATEGISAGADDYIVKPFTGRDLLVRVASKLSAARAAREANAMKENLYQHFMQAPFPIAVLRGPQHIVELANPAVLAAWGKSSSDAAGRPLLEVLPELKGQPIAGYLQDVLRTGVGHQRVAERIFLPTGPEQQMEEAYYSYVYAPLLDVHGKPEGILLSGVDVTPQVRGRQDVERARDEAQALANELASTSELLTTAQRAGRIGIYDWDIPGARLYWSPQLYALMGLKPGEVESTPETWMGALYDDSDRELGMSAFRKAVEVRQPGMEVEARLRQPGGGWRWMRVTSEIRYGASGEPVRVLGAVVDIQVLKESAEARARALLEAERVNRAKDEFLATMSHELRTPLNAMLGWAKLLQTGRRDEKMLDRGLSVIERNANAQTRLVNDLLDVSRIISGKLRLAVRKVELSAVIHAATDVVRQAADAKGVRLILDLDPELGHLAGDSERLQQVVWNLLINAVKFTPPSGTVTVTGRRRESTVSIWVADTGAGIPGEHLPHIFERFRQVDGSTTRAHGGLGLGLAIVRHLVEAHGGLVAASSEGTGTGSLFTVTLPIRAVIHEAAVPAADSTAHQAGQGATSERGGTLRGVRILVVDDEGDSLDLLRVVLEEAGATFFGASSAHDALAAAGQERFDVVISDIGMPEMDGYALIRSLRSQSVDVLAIALTAYARQEDEERALAAGFRQHLVKPVDAQALVRSIERLHSRGSTGLTGP